MLYLFDTNSVLFYLKKPEYKKWIENITYQNKTNPTYLISIVTLGELKSFVIRNNWGENKIKKLNQFLKFFLIIDVTKALVVSYAILENFSQQGIKEHHLSSRNMGKNDLWIASTAAVLKAKLITHDKDFDHLNGVFIEVLQYNI